VPLTCGDRTVHAVLFDLDDVIVPFHTPALWQWAWKPQGPALGERRTLAALRRSLHAWNRRRWEGLTGRQPPAGEAAVREHLEETLRAIAGHPLPDAETEAVVRRLLHPAGEIERYPDVGPCLQRLRAAEVRVGVVTPLPADSARWLLHRAGLAEELLLGRSDPAGPSVPDRAAFRDAVKRLDAPVGGSAFVGDLFWSDVHAAHRAGLSALLLDRTDAWPRVASGRIRSLDELESALARAPVSEPVGDPGAPPGPAPPAGEPI